MAGLRKLVSELEQEVIDLRRQLVEKEQHLALVKSQVEYSKEEPNKLTNEQIARYSRQILVPDIGIRGQLKLKEASILIVGAGGLGCPAAVYLTAAGIGTIGIVDYDTVEINNLHRQTLFTEADIGTAKVTAMEKTLYRMNGRVNINPYHAQLSSKNALKIISEYDIVLDATDNVATRYLLSDACVLAKKPLVSGSALQFDGQLTVYNYKDGPCYRCIHPKPPNPDHVQNCGDGGVLGPITGVIGSLMSLEAIKILLDFQGVLSRSLLVFDGFDGRFRTLKLRGKTADCASCSENPTIIELIDYEMFCGAPANDKDRQVDLLQSNERISAQEYLEITTTKTPHLLVDVRMPNEMEICALQNSMNISIEDIKSSKIEDIAKDLASKKLPIFIVCRRGNDSQKAVKMLKEHIKGENAPKDIIGGLHAWTKNIDPGFPIY
ncbi:adenylyltransferase and sulfurtransferase MOCS3 [Phlebotomus argentipes]|uniref:adenylyltransferase and sulfurtransferase MOCS3 n=1 Tax=Phlebotomus argentipes TaxID=94469 RepID=UPI002892F9F5|nr:adenylyltransferase and sulfurtransferase MOCS3 [Phlebotomus argentipes]